MGKIPRQRTGSGGWPDRRRSSSYRSKNSKSSGCALILVIAGAVASGGIYAMYEIAKGLFT